MLIIVHIQTYINNYLYFILQVTLENEGNNTTHNMHRVHACWCYNER